MTRLVITEKPLTADEWKVVRAIVQSAMRRALLPSGLRERIPNVSVWRGEMGANNYKIQRWNDETLDPKATRAGASADPHLPRVYDYIGKYVGGLTPHARVDVTHKTGPWQSDVRGMVNEIADWMDTRSAPRA